MRKLWCFAAGLLAVALAACSPKPTPAPPMPAPVAGRKVPAASVARKTLATLPTYDARSNAGWQVDLRSADLSGLDLSGREYDLSFAIFDTRTLWPGAAQLPAGFDPQRILELGKNPGLGVRSLHAQGITGKGVGIAIINRSLLGGHPEIAGQLRLYEEINMGDQVASMYGTTVASLAVGKTTGVAPDADLYYFGVWPIAGGGSGKYYDADYGYYAQAIRRVLEVNRTLPVEGKIRVICLETRGAPENLGYAQVTAAIDEAKKQGMLVICPSMLEVSGLDVGGLGRSPLADPESPDSYGPATSWANDFYASTYQPWQLYVPMDARTAAAPNEATAFAFYREGGLTSSMPYLAGLYALAAQADPKITPERFWQTAVRTARTIQVVHDGKRYPLGPVVDPPALIAALAKP